MDSSSQFPNANDKIPYIDENMDLRSPDGERNDTVNPSASNNNSNNRQTQHQHGKSVSDDGIMAMCGKWSFPWLLSVSVVQLAIYLNKLYQDSAAVAVYYDGRDVNYCIVSAACLLIPAVIYIVYVVALYIKQQQEIETKEIGTRVVHGLLLVPWQIKGRVEVLHFSAQRVCQRRKLTPEEHEEKLNLERQAAVLEFFEEFYAGFMQLLLQLYIIIVSLDKKIDSKALPGEIVASILTLMSMMAAVRRKDDGLLTGMLSVIGWLSIITSRAVGMALASTVIHGWMIIICLLHSFFVSLWLSGIAIDSYQHHESAQYSLKRKIATFFFIFTVFGLPSLTYWPIMFQLKEKRRPMIFLMLMLLENILFFCLWYFLRKNELWGKHDYILVSVLAAGYVMGTLFILMYICCKPKYTDQVVYHDMKIRNADSFGMYFEFCDFAFKLPQTEALEIKLEKVRTQGPQIAHSDK